MAKQGGGSAFWPWLSAGLANVTQIYGQNGETGVDMGLPQGTAITSLTAGRVVGAGYYGGGGVVSVLSVVNNKPASVYYQHLDLIAQPIADAIQAGRQLSVQPGDLIGYSGGQLSGGHHPSSRQFSTGPHMEVGINAPFGKDSMWHPVGPNYDPLPWLRQLEAHNGPLGQSNLGGLALGGPVGVLANPPQDDFVSLLVAFKASMYTTPVQGSLNIGDTLAQIAHNVEAIAIRGVITVVGLILIAGVLANIIKRSLEISAGPVGEAVSLAGAPVAAPLAEGVNAVAGAGAAGGAV